MTAKRWHTTTESHLKRSTETFLILLSLLSLFMVCVSLTSAAWEEPVVRPLANPVQQEWRSFVSEYGVHLRAIPHRRTGSVATIEGVFQVDRLMNQLGIPVVSGSASAEAVTRAFVDENQRLFGLDSTHFPLMLHRTFGSSKFGRIHRVSLRQVYQGIPVEDGRCVVLMTEDGRFLGFELKAETGIELDVGKALNAGRATSIAVAELGKPVTEYTSHVAPELLIINEDRSQAAHRLVWQVPLWHAEGVPQIVTVDAISGGVLSAEEYGDPAQFRNQGDIMFHYYVDSPNVAGNYTTPLYDTDVATLSNYQVDVRVYEIPPSGIWTPKAITTVYGNTSGSASYNLSWDGDPGRPHVLHFSCSNSAAHVELEVDFTADDPYVYDVGSPPTNLTPSSYPDHQDRDVTNVAYQCQRMHDAFDYMDNSSLDGSYDKGSVWVDVYDHPLPGKLGFADTSSHFSVWYKGSRYEVVQHEYAHTVVKDLYDSNSGVGTSVEENSMDEAFAMYFAARVARDFASEPWGVTRNMESPTTWLYSQHTNNSDDKYNNGMILASTLWDIVQGGLSSGNDYAVPPAVPSPTGWDEIIFLTLASEKETFWEFRNRLVEMAYAWGGSGYQQFAAAKCNEHGLPTANGTWAPALSPGQEQEIWVHGNRDWLGSNYPNPFNPETWMPYALTNDSKVSILIHNMSGELVRRLTLGEREAGTYTTKQEAVYWDGRNDLGEEVSSGVYFYTLRAESFTRTRRMLVLR